MKVLQLNSQELARNSHRRHLLMPVGGQIVRTAAGQLDSGVVFMLKEDQLDLWRIIVGPGQGKHFPSTIVLFSPFTFFVLRHVSSSYSYILLLLLPLSPLSRLNSSSSPLHHTHNPSHNLIVLPAKLKQTVPSFLVVHPTYSSLLARKDVS